MSFSQYFPGMPPIYEAVHEEELSPYNLYTVDKGYKVFLPTVVESKDEWLGIMNIDNPFGMELEQIFSRDYDNPVACIKEGDDRINSVIEENGTDKVVIYPGSLALFIKRGNRWFYTLLELATLLDLKIDKINTQLTNLNIDERLSKNLITSLENEVERLEKSIFIPSFTWLSYPDLFNGNILYAPTNNELASYWEFDVDSTLNNNLVIYIPTPEFFGGEKFIKIIANNFLSSNAVYFTKYPNVDYTLHAPNDYVLTSNEIQYFNLRIERIFKLRISTFLRRYILEEVTEDDLPPDINKIDQNTTVINYLNESLTTLSNYSILTGSQFPENPVEGHRFIINDPVNHELGLYVHINNTWNQL